MGKSYRYLMFLTLYCQQCPVVCSEGHKCFIVPIDTLSGWESIVSGWSWLRKLTHWYTVWFGVDCLRLVLVEETYPLIHCLVWGRFSRLGPWLRKLTHWYTVWLGVDCLRLVLVEETYPLIHCLVGSRLSRVGPGWGNLPIDTLSGLGSIVSGWSWLRKLTHWYTVWFGVDCLGLVLVEETYPLIHCLVGSRLSRVGPGWGNLPIDTLSGWESIVSGWSWLRKLTHWYTVWLGVDCLGLVLVEETYPLIHCLVWSWFPRVGPGWGNLPIDTLSGWESIVSGWSWLRKLTHWYTVWLGVDCLGLVLVEETYPLIHCLVWSWFSRVGPGWEFDLDGKTRSRWRVCSLTSDRLK